MLMRTKRFLFACLIVVAICVASYLRFRAANTLPHERRLLVVSAGGAGTTYFMTLLRNQLEGSYRVNRLDDLDGLKHSLISAALIPWEQHDRSRVRFGVPDRIVYLLADPLRVIRSHFRHGRVEYMVSALQGVQRRELQLAWHPSNDFTAFVNATLQAQTDIFGVIAHMRAWRDIAQSSVPAPRMFVSLRQAAAAPDAVCAFLDLPRTCIWGLTYRQAQFEQPGDSPVLADAQQAAQLDALYADAAAEFVAMDGLILQSGM